jgi:hypothetical protein
MNTDDCTRRSKRRNLTSQQDIDVGASHGTNKDDCAAEILG